MVLRLSLKSLARPPRRTFFIHAPTSLTVWHPSPVISNVCGNTVEHNVEQNITSNNEGTQNEVYVMNILALCMLGGFPTHLPRVPAITWSAFSQSWVLILVSALHSFWLYFQNKSAQLFKMTSSRTNETILRLCLKIKISWVRINSIILACISLKDMTLVQTTLNRWTVVLLTRNNNALKGKVHAFYSSRSFQLMKWWLEFVKTQFGGK